MLDRVVVYTLIWRVSGMKRGDWGCGKRGPWSLGNFQRPGFRWPGACMAKAFIIHFFGVRDGEDMVS